MYHQSFRLREEPFGVTPDPRFFYESPQHQEALAALYCALTERRGFAALIAQPGLGKSTLVAALSERLSGDARIIQLAPPFAGEDAVVDLVLEGLGLAVDLQPAERLRSLGDALKQTDGAGRMCVVIVDEAQHLSVQAIERLRLLSNFETSRRKLIQFVFVGQPALGDLLDLPECEQIRQRLAVIATLSPLSPGESARYIEHRLAIAGAEDAVISDRAVTELVGQGRGIPRRLNALCFGAFVNAYASGRSTVDVADIREAIADVGSLGSNRLRSSTAVAAVTPEPARVYGMRRVLAFLGLVVLTAVVLLGAALAIRPIFAAAAGIGQVGTT